MKNQENQCTRLSDWDWQQKRKTFDISNEFFWYVYVKLILLLTFGRWRISTVGLKIIKHRAVSLAPLILLDCGNKRISAENWFFFCYLHFRLRKTADDAHEFVTKTNHIVRRLSIFIDFQFSISYRFLYASMRPSKTVNNNHVPRRRWRNENSAWVSSRLMIFADGIGYTEIKWKSFEWNLAVKKRNNFWNDIWYFVDD